MSDTPLSLAETLFAAVMAERLAGKPYPRAETCLGLEAERPATVELYLEDGKLCIAASLELDGQARLRIGPVPVGSGDLEGVQRLIGAVRRGAEYAVRQGLELEPEAEA